MSEQIAPPLYQDVHWDIDYQVRLGVAWSRFMRGLQNQQLWATACSRCNRTFVPPQSYCESCYEKIDDWKQLEPVGSLGASTIVYQGFAGGPEAPYAVGAIRIDGTDTQLMHFIGGIDLSDATTARARLAGNKRVRAVWADNRVAAITDIAHFEIGRRMKLESTPEVSVTYEGKVATITLNRPEVLNAVNEQMLINLSNILQAANRDESSALVITGAGRAFCAGGDHQTLRENIVEDSGAERIDLAVAQMINAFLILEKPILAAVNGVAIGLGATIALHCDYIAISEDTRIGDRHVLIGLVPGSDAAVWTMLLGPLKAKEILMAGRLLTAAEAEAAGLVSKVVPADSLVAAVQEHARLLADLPAFAVRKTKLSVNRYMKLVTDAIFPVSYAWEQLSTKTADHEDALAAFKKGLSDKSKG